MRAINNIAIVVSNDFHISRFATDHVRSALRATFGSAAISTVHYRDLGAPYDSGLALSESFDLIVLPGINGLVSPYPRMFRDAYFKSNMSSFVQYKAVFAICAGAYAVSESTTFHFRDQRGTVKKKSPLNDPWLPLAAEGPIDNFDPILSDRDFGDTRLVECAVPLHGKIQAPYADGPAYDLNSVLERDDMEVLMGFDEERAAVVARQFEQGGVVIGTGVLIDTWPEHFPTSCERHARLKAQMEPHDAGFRSVWERAAEIIRTGKVNPDRWTPQQQAAGHGDRPLASVAAARL